MSREKIHYIPGQLVGGMVYIRDEDPQIRANGKKRRMVRAVCPLCGESFTVRRERLSSGNLKSCGCIRARHTQIKSIRNHGLTGTHVYNVWRGMVDRCYNKDSVGYRWYGSVGITVYLEWLKDPRIFADYVTGLPNYGKPGYTLDRYPNKYGNYEPGNVRWASWREQNNNRKQRDPSLKRQPMSKEARDKIGSLQKKPVLATFPGGEENIYDSINEAVIMSGVSRSSINRSLKHNKKTRWGFLFEFI